MSSNGLHAQVFSHWTLFVCTDTTQPCLDKQTLKNFKRFSELTKGDQSTTKHSKNHIYPLSCIPMYTTYKAATDHVTTIANIIQAIYSFTCDLQTKKTKTIHASWLKILQVEETYGESMLSYTAESCKSS